MAIRIQAVRKYSLSARIGQGDEIKMFKRFSGRLTIRKAENGNDQTEGDRLGLERWFPDLANATRLPLTSVLAPAKFRGECRGKGQIALEIRSIF